METPDNTQKLEISLDEQHAMGVYSNATGINNSPTEFVVDFMNIMPGVPKAKVVSRVILNPVSAKRLLMVLNENIRAYENVFGTITEPESVMIKPKGEA
ncbi:MAG: DUF3467 domain-containing protein [Flavobacteriales bacterium]|nr:DUF3467 domain-containing protein [Flavobacteriales bacterium]